MEHTLDPACFLWRCQQVKRSGPVRQFHALRKRGEPGKTHILLCHNVSRDARRRVGSKRQAYQVQDGPLACCCQSLRSSDKDLSRESAHPVHATQRNCSGTPENSPPHHPYPDKACLTPNNHLPPDADSAATYPPTTQVSCQLTQRQILAIDSARRNNEKLAGMLE